MGGGGGGSKDYTQEQYDWDMKKHDYDYARMEDKYQYTKEELINRKIRYYKIPTDYVFKQGR